MFQLVSLSVKVPVATAVRNLNNMLKKISCHITGHFDIQLSSKADKCTLKYPGLNNIIIMSSNNLAYIFVAI